MSDETKTPSVLIIEDDRDIAAYYRHVLDMAGYRTGIAANGKTALEKLYQDPPDIVLLDLSLPGVSGVEILKLLKSDEKLMGTRVVVVTGYSQIAENLPVEPDLVMMKPVSPGQLAELVWRLLEHDKSIEKRPFGKSPWDKTTGLYNRAFYLNRLDDALQNVKKDMANKFGVLLVSPDRDPGQRAKAARRQKDPLLQEIAQSLKTSLRPTDTLARFESDHFFILIENIPGGEILAMIAGRIQLSLEKHEAAGLRFGIGAVLCDAGHEDVDEILQHVRTARSQAKTDGPSRCRIFDRPTIQSLEKELSRAEAG